MIGKLEGRYDTALEGAVVVMVGGVGYSVFVPLGVATSLKPDSPVSLYIYTAVREDAIDLYGFSNQDDLAFFKQLIGVSGIGPKSALGIMNVADSKTLKRSIAQGDNSMLTKVFGIGKKSAERIVVELRDKLAEEHSKRGESLGGGDGEVMEALLALGYSAAEARRAVKEVGAVEGSQQRIAAALKYLGSGK
jgi:Holliday junction DNA helicase RuvA